MMEKDTYTINDIKQLLKEYNRDKYGGYDRNYYVNIYIQGMPLTYLLHEKDFYTPEEIDKAWYAYPNTLTYAREDFYLGAYREDYFISSSSSDKKIIKKFVYKVKEDFWIFIYLIERNKPEIKVSFGPKSEPEKIEVEEQEELLKKEQCMEELGMTAGEFAEALKSPNAKNEKESREYVESFYDKDDVAQTPGQYKEVTIDECIKSLECLFKSYKHDSEFNYQLTVRNSPWNILKLHILDLKLQNTMNPPREVTLCGTGPCSKEEEEEVMKKLKELKQDY